MEVNRMAPSDPVPSWPWLPKGFASTRWSLVRRSTLPDAVDSRAAAEVFCRVYWFPLYSFLRGKGYTHIDTQDHVQSFLAKLIHRGTLVKADPAKGRLRHYLMTLVLRHAAARHHASKARKRGGEVVHLSIDWTDAEAGYLAAQQMESEPDAMFRQQLAVRLVEESVASLGTAFAKAGRQELFAALLPSLEGVMTDCTFAELAGQLGMTEGAVRVASCRLRERFRKSLRQVASLALGMPVGLELDEELRQIFG